MRLDDLSDEELLELRFCDLKLDPHDRPMTEWRAQLYLELDQIGLTQFRPDFFYGDEWFSPEGQVAIAVPFYLAHPRLIALEKSQMREAEGEDPSYFMKLLRHEAGHCFEHMFRVSRRQSWKKIFGSPDVDYHPESYRPRPHSKNFVQNLDHWYAQSHPDEDFCETFAVVCNPDRSASKEYARWEGALHKVQYVLKLINEFQGATIRSSKKPKRYISDVRFMRSRLGLHYQRRRADLADQFPDFYDRDLIRLFGSSNPASSASSGSAARFLKKHRREIIDRVGFWTRAKKYTVELIVKRVEDRAQELRLQLSLSENETLLEVIPFFTTLIMNYLFTGRFTRRA